ncbi:MAG: GNAT family N-acetyltransferase [Candidatus Acidiferrales bacterium]
MTFLVRLAVAADSDSIAEAHVNSIRSLGAKCYQQKIINEWGKPRSGAPYRQAMRTGEVYFVAVETQPGEAERIAGFSSYLFEGGKHRTAVYVRGDCSRCGIGTALFSKVETYARQRGAREIDVDASLAAVEFYMANGFQELGTGEHELKSGTRMACVFMRKQL